MGKINRTEVYSKNGESIALRSATQSDARKIHDLAIAVFETSDFLVTTSGEFASFNEDLQRERLKKFEADDGCILLLAEYKAELIGMLDFQNGKRIRIAHKGTFGMSVREGWRNKGIGRILLASLINWVKEHPSIEVINLSVIEENKSAVALYLRMGFQITGREPYGVKLADGKYLPELLMTLRIQKSIRFT